MNITVLGSGTSSGVPVIGCDCAVCVSSDPKDNRLRPSIYIDLENDSSDSRYILIDSGPDFREQAIKFKLPRVDAVLYTHSHADHIFGLDDLRIYNFKQRGSIPIYANEETSSDLMRIFKYCFIKDPNYEGGGIPNLVLNKVVGGQPFNIGKEVIMPINIYHGKKQILGFRVRDFAYLTDCNKVEQDSMMLLRGVSNLIVSGLRHRPHRTHFTINEAIKFSQETTASKVFLTHISHEIRHSDVTIELGESYGNQIQLAYDGLVLK